MPHLKFLFWSSLQDKHKWIKHFSIHCPPTTAQSFFLLRTAPQPCQFYIPWIHKEVQTKIPHKHLFVRFVHFRYMHACAVWFLLPHSLCVYTSFTDLSRSLLFFLFSCPFSFPAHTAAFDFCHNIKVFAGFLFSNTDEDAHHERRNSQRETSPASCRLSVPGWLTIDMGLR